jgi:hypothetical protein
MATHKCKLQIDTGKDFTDAGTLKEPIRAHFTDFVWDLGVINLILIGVCDDYLAARMFLSQFLHATVDKRTEVI